jgi:hypothetical protein
MNPSTQAATAIAWIAGTVAGLLVGHILSGFREHRKWLNDQKKAEYKELIDQLYVTVTVVLANKDNGDKRDAFNEAIKKLALMFEDRIFVAQEIESVADDWLELKKVMGASPELKDVTPKEFLYSEYNVWERENKLRKKLVKLARKDIVRFSPFK